MGHQPPDPRTIRAESLHEELTRQLHEESQWDRMDAFFKAYLAQPKPEMGTPQPHVHEPVMPQARFLPQKEEIEAVHIREHHTAWENYKHWLRSKRKKR